MTEWILTLNMQGPSYLGLTMSVSLLLMLSMYNKGHNNKIECEIFVVASIVGCLVCSVPARSCLVCSSAQIASPPGTRPQIGVALGGVWNSLAPVRYVIMSIYNLDNVACRQQLFSQWS